MFAASQPVADFNRAPKCAPSRISHLRDATWHFLQRWDSTDIRQYFYKASSGHGYGHAIRALPHLLVVHLPDGGRAGIEQGWTSKDYHTALRSVDRAMGSVLEIFKEQRLLTRTTVFVTSLSGTGAANPAAANGQPATVAALVPWIASGVGIKAGHVVRQPVSIVDTSATVLRAFQLETHTEWDSRVVEEIFRDTGAISAIPTKGR